MIAEKIHIDVKAVMITIAISLTGFLAYFEQNVVGDISLLSTLIKLMLLDFVTGVCKAYIRGTKKVPDGGFAAISSGGFRQSIGKSVQYGAFIIVTQVISTASMMHEHIFHPERLLAFAYMALYVTETKSILENITEINPKLTILKSAVNTLKDLVTKLIKK